MKKITDELVDVFLKNNIDAVAGNLLCSTCYIKSMKMKNTLIERRDHSASLDELSAFPSSFSRSKAIEEANTQISDNFPDISPIKLHSISQTRSSSGLYAANRKLSQVDEKVKAKKQSLQKIFELIFNVEPRKLEENIKSKEERNSEDLECLISLIKEKLQKYTTKRWQLNYENRMEFWQSQN